MTCDNCGYGCEETHTIKWPGLDTGMQYEEVCEECKKAFYNWRKSRGMDKTIFKLRGRHECGKDS